MTDQPQTLVICYASPRNFLGQNVPYNLYWKSRESGQNQYDADPMLAQALTEAEAEMVLRNIPVGMLRYHSLVPFDQALASYNPDDPIVLSADNPKAIAVAVAARNQQKV